jgi:hypothetical protein
MLSSTLYLHILYSQLTVIGLILRYNASKYLEMKQLKTTEESSLSNESQLLEQFYTEDVGESEPKEIGACTTCCLQCVTCLSKYSKYLSYCYHNSSRIPVKMQQTVQYPPRVLQSREIFFKSTSIQ